MITGTKNDFSLADNKEEALLSSQKERENATSVKSVSPG
jgi:hypothetical protein